MGFDGSDEAEHGDALYVGRLREEVRPAEALEDVALAVRDLLGEEVANIASLREVKGKAGQQGGKAAQEGEGGREQTWVWTLHEM